MFGRPHCLRLSLSGRRNVDAGCLAGTLSVRRPRAGRAGPPLQAHPSYLGADAAVAHVSVARYAVRHGGAAVTHCHVTPHAMLDPLAARNAVDAGHVAAHVAEGHAGASHGTLAEG